MDRSAFSRRVAILVTFGSIAASIGLAARSAQSQSADAPPRGVSARELIANGIFFQKDALGYRIPQTGNPEVDAMVRAKAREQIRADVRETQRLINEASHQKHLAQMKIWRGTKVRALPDAIPSSLERVYETAAPKFAQAPSPASRNELFAQFFGDAAKFKCLGWDARVESIVPKGDEWELTVRVWPQLDSERGGIVRTPQSSVETWNLASQGELQFVKAKTEGFPFIFVD